MKYKLVGIFICTLLLLTIFPPVEATTPDDDIKILVFAGNFGLPIGQGIRFVVLNFKNENITVYDTLVLDYFIRDGLDFNETQNRTVEPNSERDVMYFPPRGFCRISLTVEVEDKKVKREGIFIWHVTFLLK